MDGDIRSSELLEEALFLRVGTVYHCTRLQCISVGGQWSG